MNALLAFAPMHAGGLSAQAMALQQLDHLEEALRAANAAVSAAPSNPEAHNTVGLVLQAMGRFEPALAAFDRAAELPGPARETALVNRAQLFMEFGQTARARTEFEAVTAAFPNSVAALFNQTDLRRFSADDPAIARLQALLEPDATQSRLDRMMVHYVLGNVFLDLGQSEQAFHHLDEGNRMKRATIAYDPDEASRWMASIAEVFTADFLNARAGQGMMSRLPVFVFGMPRSGTTLVEQVLASHPAVHGAGELRHLQTLADAAGSFPHAIPGLTAAQLHAMGEAYLAKVTPLARGHRHVVDKMPANFLRAGLIRLILPEARIIHCRRDPVDTCLSCYGKLFAADQPYTYNQTELGRFHADYQRLMEHWRAVLPASRFIEVDYEAVVDDLETEARRLLGFLDLPRDDACLRFHETARRGRTRDQSNWIEFLEHW